MTQVIVFPGCSEVAPGVANNQTLAKDLNFNVLGQLRDQLDNPPQGRVPEVNYNKGVESTLVSRQILGASKLADQIQFCSTALALASLAQVASQVPLEKPQDITVAPVNVNDVLLLQGLNFRPNKIPGLPIIADQKTAFGGDSKRISENTARLTQFIKDNNTDAIPKAFAEWVSAIDQELAQATNSLAKRLNSTNLLEPLFGRLDVKTEPQAKIMRFVREELLPMISKISDIGLAGSKRYDEKDPIPAIFPAINFNFSDRGSSKSMVARMELIAEEVAIFRERVPLI
jgi:hypothetical protein